MNRLVSAQWETNCFGSSVLRFRKTRGKLTLDEIEEYIRYADYGRLRNQYVILLNTHEAACEGSGWEDDVEEKGDVVDLYPLQSGEPCPVCTSMLPISDYCPECGAQLNAIQK